MPVIRQRVGYQPQQSVLKPQAGQRQTACILNISALQRSQTTADSAGGTVVFGRRGGGFRGSVMAESIGSILDP